MLRRLVEGIEEEENVGVLRSGKRFWLNGAKRTVTDREGEYSPTEWSDYGSVLPDDTEIWEIETATTPYQSDEESLPAEYYVDPTIRISIHNSEVRPESLALISFPSSNPSVNHSSGSGSFVLSQTSPRASEPRRMADDIRMPTFSGNGSQDPEQHMFVCEAI